LRFFSPPAKVLAVLSLHRIIPFCKPPFSLSVHVPFFSLFYPHPFFPSPDGTWTPFPLTGRFFFSSQGGLLCTLELFRGSVSQGLFSFLQPLVPVFFSTPPRFSLPTGSRPFFPLDLPRITDELALPHEGFYVSEGFLGLPSLCCSWWFLWISLSG